MRLKLCSKQMRERIQPQSKRKIRTVSTAYHMEWIHRPSASGSHSNDIQTTENKNCIFRIKHQLSDLQRIWYKQGTDGNKQTTDRNKQTTNGNKRQIDGNKQTNKQLNKEINNNNGNIPQYHYFITNYHKNKYHMCNFVLPRAGFKTEHLYFNSIISSFK